MVTNSDIKVELELRELKRKLLCNDLMKYLSSDEEQEPDTEKYDFLINNNSDYKYNEQDHTKFKEIRRFKCF